MLLVDYTEQNNDMYLQCNLLSLTTISVVDIPIDLGDNDIYTLVI